MKKIFALFLLALLLGCAKVATPPRAAATQALFVTPTTSDVSPIAPATNTREPEPTRAQTLTPVPSFTPAPNATPTLSPTPFITAPAANESTNLPILMYHHLSPLAKNASLALKTWTVSPENFRAQLDYLAANDYHTITFAQLDAFFHAHAPLPTRPIILTFDDGWMEQYQVAFPELRRRGMVGTFFVPTLYAEALGDTFMHWEQILEMDAAGMEIGGHTINHANLKQVGEVEAMRQLTLSKASMEEKLGHPTLAFAYPFGALDARVIALVQKAGYHAAVGLCCGFKQRADMELVLPRIRVSYNDDLEAFIQLLPPLNAE